MSEPSSFYAKITIKPESYEQFLRAEPAVAKSQSGWNEWFHSKTMYGKPELTENHLNTYKHSSNREIIDHWLKAGQSYSFSEYDRENETWHFGIIWFTKNYLEMIPMLSTIRGIAGFREGNELDFIIVYSYFWEPNQINAYLKFSSGNSEFVEKVEPEDLKCADLYLTKKWHQFAENILLD
ncbi:hypothetical protein [Dyadobacter sediminis]|uniref:Uncharacterized protein n=1 Tax=Dyadobacter sediminis TaxID=1493691 RepID=A0A5R9KI71_9BACT|nr:hypothetical protein [Dyadobacter sediminis]TLU95895.1 hypothetical protein FEM55_01715 [Dyadobacter sediminis]GGB77543.1 hypothetical protein GCM10011325_01250 [Dyadobacter sediminis]